VYEIRDIWPESLIDLGAIASGGAVATGLARISDSLVSQASLVVSPLPGIAQYLSERGFANKPSVWIPNGVEESLVGSLAPQTPRGGNVFTFMYLGSFGFGNALEVLVQAFADACARCSDHRLELRLVGDGPLKAHIIKVAAAQHCSERIHFEQRIPRSQVVDRAREADCLIANLPDIPVLRFGISPNKYFDYMLSERPIIAAAPSEDNPIDVSGCGITVRPSNRDELMSAMITMSRTGVNERLSMGRKGREFVVGTYLYETLAHRLASALDHLVSATTDSPSGQS
jgi:glycosyltransferase involved in cell wall biosynthesis